MTIKHFLTAFLLLHCLRVFSQENEPHEQPFTLNGRLVGRDTGNIILQTYVDKKWKADTVKLNKGKFQFKGKVFEPTGMYIKGSKEDGNEQYIYIEPGLQEIVLKENKFDDYVMTGSEIELEVAKYKKYSYVLVAEFNKYSEKYYALGKEARTTADSTRIKECEEELSKLTPVLRNVEQRIVEAKIQYVINNNNSLYSNSILEGIVANRQIDTDSAIKLNNSFTARIKNSKQGQALTLQLTQNKAGSQALNFTAADVNGDTLSLNDFKGKYVLLNFWASWCAPCVEKIPMLKSMLANYQTKGFEILNISIDKSNEKWMQAIKKYAVENFVNLIASGDIESKYSNIKMPIPSEILINKDGIVVWNSFNKPPLSLEATLAKEIGMP